MLEYIQNQSRTTTMKEKKLNDALDWIKSNLKTIIPPREELHAFIKEAAEKFNVDSDLMRRKAESSITHSIKLSEHPFR